MLISFLKVKDLEYYKLKFETLWSQGSKILDQVLFTLLYFRGNEQHGMVLYVKFIINYTLLIQHLEKAHLNN